MGEHQVTQFYCCVETLKVFEVNILPGIPGDSPTLVRIYDCDMPPRAWYMADIDRVRQTKPQAIWAAKGALDDRDREIFQEMQKLQEQRDEISRLQCIGDPENDGT